MRYGPRMKWASSLSESGDLATAIDEASASLAEQLPGGADLLIAFVSPHHAAGWQLLPAKLRERFPGALLLGCSAGGVIGGDHEVERAPGLALAAARLPGVSIVPFHLEGDEVPEPGDAEWADLLPIVAGSQPHFVLLADPFTFDAALLARGLDASFPAAAKIGGLASGAREAGGNALFLADAIHVSGCVGVALSGNLEIDTVVAQGCRPIGTPMFATRVHRNLIHQLDGRPATKVLEELFGSLADDDRKLFRSSLFLGIVMAEGASEYRQGDFLIRNIAGVDPDSGAIAVAALPAENAVVQFHLRDAKTAAQDLDAMFARYRETLREGSPAGALLFSCLGRGKFLYGEADHDTRRLQQHLGAIPVGGFFCNGEIGQVAGRTFLHGYTSSIGLFRPKRR